MYGVYIFIYLLSIDMRIKYIYLIIYIHDMVVHFFYNKSKMHIYYINMCYV